MDISFEQVKKIIGDVLQLGHRIDAFAPHTPLLGSVPEFDSMAVVSVITAIEDDLGITIDDDEISADIFLTVGDLHAFLHAK